MHIKRDRRNRALAQHHMNLPAMMCLVIEHVQHGGNRGFFTVLAFAIRVGQLIPQETGRRSLKEFLNPGILLFSGDPQSLKLIVENGMERRRGPTSARKARHPYAVPEQDMIQQPMYAAKRDSALAAIILIVNLRACLVEALIGHPVVACECAEDLHDCHER